MTRNVTVPWEERLGKIGEDAIEMRLLHFSITAKDQIDVGIDFYCHLLEDISPSMIYFGVQSKGTRHFDENWGHSIKKTTIGYWLTRPFPMYLIVYDEKEEKCYWWSVEEHRYDLIKNLHESGAATVYITVDRLHVLEKGKNEEFVRKIREDSALVELFRGRPQFKGEGYVKTIPNAPRSSNELLMVKENIRQGLYSLIVHHLQRNELEPAYLYCDFLAKFDKSHYNHFLWLGLINKTMGKKKEAQISLQEALKICESDKNWPRESIGKIITYIKEEIESCK
jgi:tetratricopeptide (TPR) repeat protein